MTVEEKIEGIKIYYAGTDGNEDNWLAPEELDVSGWFVTDAGPMGDRPGFYLTTSNYSNKQIGVSLSYSVLRRLLKEVEKRIGAPEDELRGLENLDNSV